jgi:hypothetical protein
LASSHTSVGKLVLVEPTGAKIRKGIINGTIPLKPHLDSFIQEMHDLCVLPCKDGECHQFVVFGQLAQWIFGTFLSQTLPTTGLSKSLQDLAKEYCKHAKCFGCYTPLPHYSYRRPTQKKAFDDAMAEIKKC